MLEMVLDDPRGAPELGQCLPPKLPRSPIRLDLPQPAHHKLQVRRLDAIVVARGGYETPTDRAELDAPSRDLVEDSHDESRLHVDPTFGRNELVEALQRTAERCLPP